jgi:Fe2+ or Zn2+ uptake regulation protein
LSVSASNQSTHAESPAGAASPDALAAEIRAHGLRPTPARIAILTHLREARDHPTVDGLRAALREHHHDLGQATVYQNLERLTDAGLVARFLDGAGLLRFDANRTRHHHLLCTVCGRITDVTLEPGEARSVDRLAAGVSEKKQGWAIAESQLEMRGVCPSCRG